MHFKKYPTWGRGGSHFLPWFSQLRGWEVVFVRGGQKEQDNEAFFKVTPLIEAIEDQNNESYRVVGPSI